MTYAKAPARTPHLDSSVSFLDTRVSTYAFSKTGEGQLEHEVLDRSLVLSLLSARLSAASSHAMEPSSGSSALADDSPPSRIARLKARIESGDRAAHHELAGLLGWRGPGWRAADRRAVVELLRACAVEAFEAILDAIRERRRSDVADDAVEVLKSIASSRGGVEMLSNAFRSGVTLDEKIAVTRALGAASGDVAEPARTSLEGMLNDSDASVREGVAWALATLGMVTSRDALAAAGARERDEAVRDSIADALDALPTR